jgi:hypothetical protein
MNASIIPSNFEGSVEVKTVSLQEIIDSFTTINDNDDDNILTEFKPEFVSAVGHEATAKLFSQLLKVEIPVNRITVEAHDGDVFFVFQLKKRLEEGKILNDEELSKLEYTFKRIEFSNSRERHQRIQTKRELKRNSLIPNGYVFLGKVSIGRGDWHSCNSYYEFAVKEKDLESATQFELWHNNFSGNAHEFIQLFHPFEWCSVNSIWIIHE